MSGRTYRLFVSTPTYRKLYVSSYSLVSICKSLLDTLQKLNALDFAENGEFEVTTCPFDNFTPHYKKYVISLLLPPTRIEIVKMDAGDFDKGQVLHILKTLKEKYYDILHD